MTVYTPNHVLARKLEALSPPARRVAQLLSIEGRPTNRSRILSAVQHTRVTAEGGKLTMPVIKQAMDEIEQVGLLERDGNQCWIPEEIAALIILHDTDNELLENMSAYHIKELKENDLFRVIETPSTLAAMLRLHYYVQTVTLSERPTTDWSNHSRLIRSPPLDGVPPHAF